MSRAHRELNRKSWNEATRAHNSHKGDQAAFLKQKRSTTLFPEEVKLLGPLKNRSLLHLQCNAGQDSLSLVKLGACVTGVDLSDEAVAFARRLSKESGLPARFVRSDLFDFFKTHRERYDVVFSSYGVVGWLDDLKGWARGIAKCLQRGGSFVYVDFHPAAWVFDAEGKPAYPYSTRGKALKGTGVNDYVAASKEGLVPWGYEEGVRDFKNPHATAEFAWGLGEIVQNLLDAGLTLERLDEWDYSNGCAIFQGMRAEGRRLFPAEGQPRVPMMFGLRVRKG
jgi:SAM-dependent methyltransferase